MNDDPLPEKPDTKDHQTTRNNIRARLVKVYISVVGFLYV